jgi:hypothetical protein
MDGNFKAEHLHVGRPSDDVWLSDGKGYMVEDTRYKSHLRAAKDTFEVSPYLPPQLMRRINARRWRPAAAV